MEIPIIIPKKILILKDLDIFKDNPFENVIKFVVDIDKSLISLGGDMHSDAEKKLLDQGSDQNALWGANFWPWDKPPRIEYISLINIRPADDNFGMEIELENLQKKVDGIVKKWIKL